MAGLQSIILFVADPWESAMPQLRLVRPAYHANVKVLCGYDRTQIYPERIEAADLVVIERDFPRIPGFDEVVAKARALHKPIVYETDDMLFEVPDSNIHHVTYQDALLKMMQAARLADAVVTSTPRLRDYLMQINPNTHLIPYFLDDSLWPLKENPAQSSAGEPVVIGYMGGHTHLADLESITPALDEILEKYGGRVRLRFWGGPPPESLRTHPQVDSVPLDILDYEKFAAYFSTQSCDIFVAPLKNDEFNQYKSHNKFLEYNSLGIPGVYSRCESYRHIVQEGVTGYLADGQAEWVECLTQLIENSSLRQEMGRQAQEEIKKNWRMSVRATEWREVYEGILSQYRQKPGRPEAGKDVILNLLGRAESYQSQLKNANFQLQGRLQQAAEAASSLQRKIDEQDAYFSALKQTRSWKLIEKMQNLRKTILPVGGNREAFVKSVVKKLTGLFARKKPVS